MTPAQRDLIAFRTTVFGETYAFGIGGESLDITGNAFRMLVGDPESPLIDLVTVDTSSAQGINIINEMQGMFAIRIEQATLADMPSIVPAPTPSIFPYNLTLLDTEGNALGTVMQGSFTLYEGVTV